MMESPWGVVGAAGRMGLEVLHVFGAEHCVFRSDKDGEEQSGTPGVLVDFSSHGALPRTLELCRSFGCGLVIGTTALTPDDLESLRQLGQHVPVVQSFNFSAGIAIFSMMFRDYGPLLAQWDAELLETHHCHKKDAPSGTALLLKNALGRDVATHSSRVGGVAGDHTAMFANEGEMLTMTHRALSHRVFALGALTAARFVLNQKPGFYNFEEVLSDAAQLA